MENLINVFFNPDIMSKVWPFLLQGLWMTILLSLTVVPLMSLPVSVIVPAAKSEAA
jgi:hypothetical protein